MTTKKRYNYIKKKLAQGTWPSIFTAFLSLCFMMVAIGMSFLYKGEGPLIVGALGVSSMVMALFGLFYMFDAFHDENRNYLPVKISGLFSGMMVLFWVILLVLGLL